MTDNELSFEEAMEQLEEVVTKLETKELSLSESLDKFATGVKLAKFCSTKLEQAEEKIRIIKQEANEIKIEPYQLEGEANNEN
ncbi:exodeoxyribonuclease VII small subunit [Halanaerobaculum tunisiense]